MCFAEWMVTQRFHVAVHHPVMIGLRVCEKFYDLLLVITVPLVCSAVVWVKDSRA
jgi:hypothetical protein